MSERMDRVQVFRRDLVQAEQFPWREEVVASRCLLRIDYLRVTAHEVLLYWLDMGQGRPFGTALEDAFSIEIRSYQRRVRTQWPLT